MALVDIPEAPPDLRRVQIFAGALFCGLLCILARLWYLQIARGDELLAQSEVNRSRLIRRVSPRGQIVDAKGRVLATNRPQIVVSVVPEEILKSKNAEALRLLASLINLPADELKQSIEENRTNGYDLVRVKVDVDMETATRLEEQRLNLPGVIVGPEPIRYYPQGLLFGHVLGQIGQISPEELKRRRDEGYRPGDFCGKLGVERAYDGLLRGTDGGQKIEVDARGRMRREMENTDPVPGATLRLTIDSALQRTAYEALSSWAKRGKPGAAVALDPRTGAVLALASAPSYDSNLFVTGISQEDWKSIHDHPLHPLINRAVGSASAPGSTFKIVTTAAGLETGETSPGDGASCGGVIYLGRWPKRCHRRSGHGYVDLNKALAKSCDIFYYRLGQRLGPDRIADYARRFGLGKRTGIDLLREGDPQVERRGVVPTPKWKGLNKLGPWVGGDTVDYAIGQSFLACTPLQMCNVTAAVANGGTLYRPHLVKTITTYNAQGRPHETRSVNPESIGSLGLKPGTLAALRRGMESVMESGGTGTAGAIPGVRMAGKTGTAQIRKRSGMMNNAWFVGYAPADNPRIAVCVMVEEGGHGGETAAPIARRILARYLNVPLGAAHARGRSDD